MTTRDQDLGRFPVLNNDSCRANKCSVQSASIDRSPRTAELDDVAGVGVSYNSLGYILLNPGARRQHEYIDRPHIFVLKSCLAPADFLRTEVCCYTGAGTYPDALDSARPPDARLLENHE